MKITTPKPISIMMKFNGNVFLEEENLINPTIQRVIKNPLREDAFDKDDTLKIELITEKFKDIIEILGFDLSNDSIKGMPNRVAKMYINEIFKGLNPKYKPKITMFENTY